MKPQAKRNNLFSAVAIALVAGAGTAQAGQAEYESLSNCVYYETEDTLCEVKNDDGHVLLRARRTDISTTDGFSFEINNLAYLPGLPIAVADSPVGIPLHGVKLSIAYNPSSYELDTVMGTAGVDQNDLGPVLPLNTLLHLPGAPQGLLGDTVAISLGYSSGASLAPLGAHLNDDQKYLFFTGSYSSLPIGDLVSQGIELVDFSGGIEIGSFGDGGMTLVLDGNDPYFYAGVTPPSDGPSLSISSDHEEDNSQDWGLGYSWKGQIPFKPQVPLSYGGTQHEFGATFVLDGIVPINISGVELEIDGSIFVDAPDILPNDNTLADTVDSLAGQLDLLPQQLKLGANGDISVGLGSIGKMGISLDIGSASLGINHESDYYSGESLSMFMSGELGTGQWTVFDGIPLTPTEQSLKASALFGLAIANGDVSVDDNSHLTLGGSYRLHADAVQKLVGFSVGDFQTIEGSLTISKSGMTVNGVMTTSPNIPFVTFNNNVQVSMNIPTDNPENFSMRLEGEMTLGVSGFGNSNHGVVEISSAGAYLHIDMETPVSEIALSGTVSSSDLALDGYTAFVLPLGKVTKAMQDAADDVAKAQAEVTKLNNEISRQRSIVQAERIAHARKLQDAQNAVGKAQGRINSLNSSINSNNSTINYYRSKISQKYSWYRNCSWWKKAWCWGEYTGTAAWYNGKIGYHYTVIGGLYAARTVAYGVLEVAKQFLSGLQKAAKTFPIDLDPRVAGPIAAKEIALGVLEAAKYTLANMQQIGDARGDVDLHVSSSGVSGKVTGSYCQNGDCTSLVGGSLKFTPAPEACLNIPLFGEQCMGI